ncbi:MAG: glycosyltransferase family 2 protein [Bacteroidales bacterium]|nr:glycosyltransferase family 2 protein [Bacteroidales bacterium]
MTNKLLTIAIPTWNRGEFLNVGLQKLLPEINNYKEYIQLVVSNNASTDNTENIISKYRSEYPNIEFTYYKQDKNKGLCGNFIKCRELAKGEYLWILSDDDFIEQGLMKKIIEVLLDNKDIALIFLNNWFKTNKQYEVIKLNFNQLVYKIAERITLVSAYIIKNNKKNDDELIEKFRNNDFIELIFLSKGLETSRNCIIINGKALQIRAAKAHSFNAFKAFIEDIDDVLNFYEEEAYISDRLRKYLTNRIIKNNLVKIFQFHKISKSSTKCDLKNISIRVKERFKSYSGYKINFKVSYFIPKIILKLFIIIRRLKNRLFYKLKLI